MNNDGQAASQGMTVTETIRYNSRLTGVLWWTAYFLSDCCLGGRGRYPPYLSGQELIVREPEKGIVLTALRSLSAALGTDSKIG